MAGSITDPGNINFMSPDAFVEITDVFPDPYFLLDKNGFIIAFNKPAKAKILGADHAVGEGLSLSSVMVDGDARLTKLLAMWGRSKAPLPASVEFNVKSGQSIRYFCKGSLIHPKSGDHSAFIMVQCTKQKQTTVAFVTLNEKIEQLKKEVVERRSAEREIRDLNQSLERRVEERTAELENANKQLNASLDELKKTQNELIRTERLASLGGMVAGVAHEINTPVGICVTAASYLDEQAGRYNKRYHEGSLTRQDFETFLDVASESSGIILSNLGRASGLVRSFKQLAVDQISDEQRHINMKEYFDELLVSLQPYFRNTQHQFSVSCPDDIDINSYPGAIAQIINNLISNSMVHGFENVNEGLIRIVITRDKSRVLLNYSDNGVGIKEENRKRIFDPFFTTKRNQGGSGLGMNIVYNLITSKLAGEISLDNKQSQGVNFCIVWPILETG